MPGISESPEFACAQIAEAKRPSIIKWHQIPNFKDHSGHFVICPLLGGKAVDITTKHPMNTQTYANIPQGPEAKYRYALLCIKKDKALIA